MWARSYSIPSPPWLYVPGRPVLSEQRVPSYPLEQMFLILFLKDYYSLSDVKAAKPLQANILVRRFIRISLEDPIPDDSSLSVFRVRLKEKRSQRLFARLIEQRRENGLLGHRLKIIGATHKEQLAEEVERRFGQAKRHLGLSRARCHGRRRVAIQALMTPFVIDA